MSQAPQEFVGVVSARHKELREAKKQGREAEAPKFVATPHLRKMSEINDARDQATVRDSIIAAAGATSASDAAKAVLDWCMSMDSRSVEIARAKFEAREKEKAEAKARREAERAEKKAKDAEAEAAKLKDEAAKKKVAQG